MGQGDTVLAERDATVTSNRSHMARAGRLAVFAFVGIAAGCVEGRERPVFQPTGPDLTPQVTILSPLTGQVVQTPGPLLVRVRVMKTFGLLNALSVKVIRFANRQVVAETDTAFNPTLADTAVTFIVTLNTLPNSTQLDVTAMAAVGDRTVDSEPVSVIAIDCSQPQPFCR